MRTLNGAGIPGRGDKQSNRAAPRCSICAINGGCQNSSLLQQRWLGPTSSLLQPDPVVAIQSQDPCTNALMERSEHELLIMALTTPSLRCPVCPLMPTTDTLKFDPQNNPWPDQPGLLCTETILRSNLLHIGSTTLDPIPRLAARLAPTQLGTTRLSLARLAADDMADALPESDGECGHVRRPILTPFSPVASYRPPLHSINGSSLLAPLSINGGCQTPSLLQTKVAANFLLFFNNGGYQSQRYRGARQVHVDMAPRSIPISNKVLSKQRGDVESSYLGEARLRRVRAEGEDELRPGRST
ncbi:hypothetical protein NC653_038511 [Populus alba x Populus x berolinensis]|uniref:Uncharacterized protein n=1 Tax=Populus alba x Populus x berolinensis TaxID=444605 RepID=A0AAD6LH62_9ROSI|nr:hypothetical protein NC653_038511 [Populus alba x Populus x berolinensis]